MSLMRPISSIQQDINRIFNEMEQQMFSPFLTRTRRRRRAEEGGEMEQVWAPPIDIIDEEDKLKIQAFVPGIKPENLDIEVDKDTLTLRGESPWEEHGDYYACELPHGKVYRQIRLPLDVQSEKAQANFENGLLTITLPKSAETRRHRIKVGR